MYQCKAGHLAVHKYLNRRKKEKKNKNPRMTYFFDVEKCKCCPYRDGCYKEGAKNSELKHRHGYDTASIQNWWILYEYLQFKTE